MLFLCDLPIDTEPTDNEEVLKPDNKKKLVVIIVIIVAFIVVITVSIGLILKLKSVENVSPYCMLMKNENKVCKIHNKKHEGRSLAELIISEDEKPFHQQLFNEISKGAYFDGKRLYQKEDAKEILTIKDDLNKEKASLFERYLSSTLNEEEKERYNFVIEDLAVIEEVITKLNIQEEDRKAPTKEELIEEVAILQKELDQIKLAQARQIVENQQEGSETVIQEGVSSETEDESIQESMVLPINNVQQEDTFIYVSEPSKVINIPQDIEKAATIKKSSLYINQ